MSDFLKEIQFSSIELTGTFNISGSILGFSKIMN